MGIAPNIATGCTKIIHKFQATTKDTKINCRLDQNINHFLKGMGKSLLVHEDSKICKLFKSSLFHSCTVVISINPTITRHLWPDHHPASALRGVSKQRPRVYKSFALVNKLQFRDRQAVERAAAVVGRLRLFKKSGTIQGVSINTQGAI